MKSKESKEDEIPPSQQIDAIINNTKDWRGEKLALLRAVIRKADKSIVEEVKWKKPSKPEGVAVWFSEGNLCVADILKNSVRLTFPKGASIQDKKGIFNTRMDSKTVRAVDYHEGDIVDEDALREIIKAAISLNQLKGSSSKK